MTPEPYDTRPELVVPGPPLPAIPAVDGPLDIRVVYPPTGAAVTAPDSSFVFGSVGSGRASLEINGRATPVMPNGTWLAWISLPPGPEIQLELVARRDADTVRTVHSLKRRVMAPPLVSGSVWVDTAGLSPRGRVWWSAAEPLTLRVIAVESASVKLRLPDGRAVDLVPVPGRSSVTESVRAFDREESNLRTAARRDVYTGVLVAGDIGPILGPVIGGDSVPLAGEGVLEVVRGSDTLRTSWPLMVTRLNQPLPVIELDDDLKGLNNTDKITFGRALPGGTYHWFFPAGTRATVTGRIGGDLRLQLSSGHTAWVSAAEAIPLPQGASLAPAVLGSVSATALRDRAALRLPLSWRVPYQIEEQRDGITVTLHNTVGDPNWIRHGSNNRLISRVSWRQRAADVVELTVTLKANLWGYRSRWQDDDLILELRPRPGIDTDHPLRGRLIVIDPGHPPLGATGPSGLTEAEANLGVALVLERLLQRDGARVIMTRRDGRPVDLWPRVKLADSIDADLLVSIHNNALPDGLNPFTNNGSSVFYFHPRSIPLAQAIQLELQRHLPLRGLGIARGDLALVRGTWMPSVLVEGMFMMIPEQEAALRSPLGQQAYAESVRAGIRAFLGGEGM